MPFQKNNHSDYPATLKYPGGINNNLIKNILLIWLVHFSIILFSQKPTISPDEYGRWEYLEDGKLSPDGSWFYYSIQKVNGDRELCIRPIEQDTTQKIPWGESPVFSSNSKWVAFSIGFSESEKDKLIKEKKPQHKKAILLNLSTGEKHEFPAIQNIAFDPTGTFMVLQAYPAEEPKGKGSDLRLITLEDQSEITFGNVHEFAWSNQKSLLAISIATGSDAGNGIQVYNASTSQIHSLVASGSKYMQLSWHEKESHLAGLRSISKSSKDSSAYQLLAWKNIDTGQPKMYELSLEGDSIEIVSSQKPAWSDNADKISFGVRKNPSTPEKASDTKSDSLKNETKAEEKLAKLQLWHSSDVRIYPQQKAAEKRDENRSLLSVWDIEKDRMVQVGTNLLDRAAILHGWEYATEKRNENYAWGHMFGRPYHDVWITNLSNGTQKLVVEKVRYSWSSPGGHYLLWYNGKDYMCHDILHDTNTNITRSIPSNFVNQEYDTPTDILPPFGVGGWLEDDNGVLLYDQFDIWLVSLDGTGGKKLTNGTSEEVIHRIVNVYPDEDYIDSSRPQFVSLRGEWTEKRGYSRLNFNGGVEPLVFENKMMGSLSRADSTDVFIFSSEARDDSPDWFVTNLDFKIRKQLTNTNPWMEDYAWTRSELIEFESEAGLRLQTGLLYPVNYKAGNRYPMIVYTYEILSPGIHNFEPPSMRDYYNFTTWTQNGYFVLLPDIKYRPRDPGISAIEAVRPAIRKVVDKGLVDSEKVGLIGHSWGGYQATYIPTRTKLFAASVAGAPLTDFVSFMGQIHWNPGIPEVDHWETGQARMEVPFWEDPEAHFRNSPIHKIHELETPILMAFGNEDGVVDWDQGTEFYNFARRAGKQMVLLVYEEEDHGFRQKANQMDYHQRILEWFGHYLKGDPAPDWIIKGISLEDQKNEIKRLTNTKN